MDYDRIEREIERKATSRDRKKRKRMKVSGKSVFLLQRLGAERAAKRILKLKRKK